MRKSKEGRKEGSKEAGNKRRKEARKKNQIKWDKANDQGPSQTW